MRVSITVIDGLPETAKPGLGKWRWDADLVWWDATVGPARLTFSTRRGGVSAPPYDSLNLGLHVGDAPEAVAANRHRFWPAATHGILVPALAEQVHGTATAVAGSKDAGRGWRRRETAIPDTDALVTAEPRVAMAVLVADCAPVALVSPEGVLAVVHAGWRGLSAGVLEAALGQIEAQGGGPPGACEAVVGPCIRGCCYVVGEEVWSRFPAECLTPSDRPHARRLDLMAAVCHRLRSAGVPAAQIHPLGLCTACRPDLFFSHRHATQQGLPSTGRMALFAYLTEPLDAATELAARSPLPATRLRLDRAG